MGSSSGFDHLCHETFPLDCRVVLQSLFHGGPKRYTCCHLGLKSGQYFRRRRKKSQTRMRIQKRSDEWVGGPYAHLGVLWGNLASPTAKASFPKLSVKPQSTISLLSERTLGLSKEAAYGSCWADLPVQ